MRTCPYKDKECPLNYAVNKCTKYQDCQHDEIELERLREENEKLKEQLKACHFSKVRRSVQIEITTSEVK